LEDRTVPNANPIALDVFASTHAGTTVNLFADASDPDNDPISITSIGHTVSGHGNDYRVASASDAQQLLWDAYDATAYGRLPLRRPGTDEWQAGDYLFGHHFDTDYKGDPKKNAFKNNLQHARWIDKRTAAGHIPADGHIYYGTWTGPHHYNQPPQGW